MKQSRAGPQGNRRKCSEKSQYSALPPPFQGRFMGKQRDIMHDAVDQASKRCGPLLPVELKSGDCRYVRERQAARPRKRLSEEPRWRWQ